MYTTKLSDLNILILSIILFLPKINLITIPGTYVGIRIEDIIVAIYVVLLFIKIFIYKTKLSNQLINITKIFMLYWSVCLFSNIYNVIFNELPLVKSTLYLFRKLEYYIYIYIGYDYIKNYRNLSKIKKLLNISVVYNLIIVVLQRLNIIPVFTTSGVYYGYSGDRCFSFFNGPYEFAGYLMIISCYYSYLISNKEKRKINIILITITYILLLLTKSRISLIASLAINYLIFLRFNKNPAKLFFKTIFICLLALIIAVIIPQTRNLLNRFTSIDFNEMILTAKIAWKTRYYDTFVLSRDYKYDTILKLYKGDMSWAIRSSKWAVLIEGFLKSPLIGQGQSFALEAADGDYIRLLSESGIIGTCLFISLCVNVVKIFKNKDTAIYSLIKYGMLSLLISAIFIDVFESSKVMMFYWFICGVAFKNLVLDYKSNRIEN